MCNCRLPLPLLRPLWVASSTTRTGSGPGAQQLATSRRINEEIMYKLLARPLPLSRRHISSRTSKSPSMRGDLVMEQAHPSWNTPRRRRPASVPTPPVGFKSRGKPLSPAAMWRPSRRL
ncbi:hypothetical protein CCM_00056 [Cordyceps militaris CM01]|uniref:Uncharacterized protein n=1 Tax=Cordyceps militaris (strain CM01) TaxID=983644 RepID=G3J6S4_CORMM|nr:uncharacterized protein CCM_00056 [Cordyceps militaris CM01]EGX95402.1 hypothetical protein CCM_00056 [Cordyceps militaris CM01]